MPASPFVDALELRVRDEGSRLAVVSESERRSLTFAALGAGIRARKEALATAGIGAGGLVALSAGNSIAFLELFFALRSLGAGVLAVDGGLPREAAEAVSSRMGASWMARADGVARIEPAAEVPKGTEIVKLTSGSTLSPRGACFTEAALLHGVRHLLRGMDLGADDRVLISIPLSHSYGFDSGLLSLAEGGTALLLQPDPTPAALLGTMRTHGATFFPAVPALVRALSQVRWPEGLALRKVACASAPLSSDAAEAFRLASGRRVQQFLGSTETGGISFETDPADPDSAGAVGRALPGVTVHLDGEGRVRVSSPANRFALIPPEPAPDWVETGDRGEFTPGGRLRLLGRASLTANVGGVKIDLGSVEAYLRGLPGVEESVTLAVEDAARGHRIVAFVEGRGCRAGDLLSACRGRLAPKEIPAEIRVLERLPRTERGKPDRAALAAMA
jgi:acyl-CoA synthetase (AMP-forming)/AMP-acid ligase II